MLTYKKNTVIALSYCYCICCMHSTRHNLKKWLLIRSLLSWATGSFFNQILKILLRILHARAEPVPENAECLMMEQAIDFKSIDAAGRKRFIAGNR